MMQKSFSEWYSEVKNMQRVAEGITRNKELRENYDPAEWAKARIVLSNTPFPDRRFKEEGSGAHKVNAGESHEVGKEIHSLTTFELKDKIAGFPASWRFSYCSQCRKVINKFCIVSNMVENSGYRRFYVRGGTSVTKDVEDDIPEEKPSNKADDFAKALDDFTSFGGDLDGD